MTEKADIQKMWREAPDLQRAEPDLRESPNDRSEVAQPRRQEQ